MVDRPTDDSGDGGGADEGKILSPHELDITESEYVEEIDEGRYVVSPDSPRTDDPQGGRSSGSQGGGRSSQGGGQSSHGGERLSGNSNTSGGAASQRGTNQPANTGKLSEEEVRRWLRKKYQRSNSKYAFDVTAQFDGTVSQRRMASNDLITVFESLMLWYAQQVDSSMPVEEVLGILLMESNIPIRYPPDHVKNIIRSAGLGPDDTVTDLLEAVEDGVQF